MSRMLVVGSTSVLGVAIAFAYADVLGNVFRKYPVEGSGGYFESPYWVGMPHTRVLTGFQALAGVGYLMWLFHVTTNRPRRGLFADAPYALPLANTVFLLASVAWPYLAHRMLKRETLGSAVAACVPLWVAAAAVAVFIGAAAEDRDPSPVPLIGSILLGVVVILVDGIGWAASAIYAASHP